MKWNLWPVTAAILAAVLLAPGCAEDRGLRPVGAESAAAEETETIVKNADEYREDAAREITAEKVEKELSTLQKEIEADLDADDE